MTESGAELVRLLRYAADCVQYAERIMELNDCNNCGHGLDCIYAPKGKNVLRINCPHWKEEKT